MIKMYKVLLVDDEPIILSGIKFLINWESHDCEVIGTASNGKEAIEFIEAHMPDIVICDIMIPVISGINVLEQVSANHPNIVFIMLTNHQDFNMAQMSLRLKAVDYLLKTNLEPATLEKAVSAAKAECDNRRKINRVDYVDKYLATNKIQILSDNLKTILTGSNSNDLKEAYDICEKNNIFNSFYIIKIMMDFSDIHNIASFTYTEKNRLYEWEKDIISKISKGFFPQYTLVPSDSRSIIVYIWNCPVIQKNIFSQYYKKLATSSKNVAEIKVNILITNRSIGRESVDDCIQQLSQLENQYYSTKNELIFFDEVDVTTYRDNFDINIIINELTPFIRSKNINEINRILNELIELFTNSRHQKKSAINCCIKLYNYFLNSLSTYNFPDLFQQYFGDSEIQVSKAANASTFVEIVDWLKTLQNNVTSFLKATSSTSNNSILNLTKNYINAHVFEKISLADVASHINISPSYLSSIFKKHYEQSFVDYVNMVKIEKACELIKENNYLIYQISYMLGYENAYYFSKVFRKYIGMTPKEYQISIRGGENT